MQVNHIIVTGVNLGYIPLLQNLRLSLSQVGLLPNLIVFAYGKRCHQKLAELGIQSFMLKSEMQIDKVASFRKQNWKYLTYQKIRALNLALKTYGDFLYTDPDVVFQRDPFPFLGMLPDCFDIYGQREMLPNQSICSGFMYIKRNSNTESIFGVSWEDYQKETGLGDQMYINKNRNQLKLYYLPKELFLGGVWFCKYPQFALSSEILQNAYIAHYNFTSCILEKYIRMKKNQHVLVLPALSDRMFIAINGVLIFAERSIQNLIKKMQRVFNVLMCLKNK